LLGNERWRRLTWKDLAEALNYFRSAVALDPLYARAHANIAWTHVCSVFLETAGATSLDEALRHIERALDIDDSDAWSHGVFGQLLFLLKRDDEAEIHLERALALNPNDADVAAVFANILVGEGGKSRSHGSTRPSVSIHCPLISTIGIMLALYSGREYEQAIRALKEMRSLDRWSRGLLAACYAQISRPDDARAEMDAFIDERERALDLALSRADRYRNTLDREHFLDGLRKAGLTD